MFNGVVSHHILLVSNTRVSDTQSSTQFRVTPPEKRWDTIDPRVYLVSSWSPTLDRPTTTTKGRPPESRRGVPDLRSKTGKLDRTLDTDSEGMMYSINRIGGEKDFYDLHWRRPFGGAVERPIPPVNVGDGLQ